MKYLQKPAVQILAVVALALAAYANTFQVPFLFDDVTSIVDNPVIRDLGSFLGGDGLRYNPRRFVGYLSLALNYRLGGLDVSGYHAFNLAVHAGCSVILYLLLRLTLRTPFFTRNGADERIGAMRRSVPFLAALLFALHPVQTQAVTYVIQRLASLATLFYLSSVLLYVAGRVRHSEQKGRAGVLLRYGGALICALMAMGSKETAFTLPLALALYEIFFFGDARRKLVLLAAPLLLSVVVALLALAGGSLGGGELLADITEKTRLQTDLPRLDYLCTEFRVIVTYLRLLIFPAGQNLDYDYPVYHTLLSLPVLLSFLLIFLLVSLSLYLYLRSAWVHDAGAARSPGEDRLLSFAILWFFLTLSVESSLIPIVDVIFEHRLYLPVAGGATAGALLFFRLMTRFPGWGSRGAVAMVLAGLTALTWQRNAVWRDGLTLWSDTVAKSPAKARPHLNLGSELLRRGRTDEAIAEFRSALGIRPDYAQAYCDLGAALNAKGLYPEALEALSAGLRLAPDNADALNNAGTSFALQGEPSTAISYFQAALEIAPDNERYRHNLAAAREDASSAAAK